MEVVHNISQTLLIHDECYGMIYVKGATSQNRCGRLAKGGVTVGMRSELKCVYILTFSQLQLSRHAIVDAPLLLYIEHFLVSHYVLSKPRNNEHTPRYNGHNFRPHYGTIGCCWNYVDYYHETYVHFSIINGTIIIKDTQYCH